MNPSLPGLPATTATPGLSPGGTTETPLNQADSESSGDFDGLLDEAFTAFSTPEATISTAPQDDPMVPGELQVLPQDGKLLPLLQQTLDQLLESGIDPQQFLERLSAKLESLTHYSEQPPVEQLAVALQQLIQEQPALKSVLPGEALALVAGNKAAQQFLRAGNAGTVANGLSEQARQAAASGVDPEQSSIKPVQPYHPVQQPLAREGSTAATDTSLSQLQQLPVAGEQPEPELAALMDTLKRMMSGDRPAKAPTEHSFRPDLPIAAAVPTVTHTSPAASVAPAVSISTPFGQAGWDQALGERIQWLAGQKLQGAQVKLNPANLGPMEVRVQVHNDQASVQFTAQHAVVREALEAALPRLRDMFEASGVELVDVDVSSGESFAEQQQAMQDPSRSQANQPYDGDEPVLETRLETPLSTFGAPGYLDLFA